jgi:hypothetical protein
VLDELMVSDLYKVWNTTVVIAKALRDIKVVVKASFAV